MIYTKTGDKGKTSTFDGKRIAKNSKLINAIGTIDELNSYLGLIDSLEDIQKNLFTINAILTGASLEFPRDATKKLEREIDKMEGGMSVQTNFLIYGGSIRSRRLYYARALCRRAEREIVDLRFKNHESGILQYINRLSDYLFILAKYTNFKKGIKEKVWKK